MNVDSKVKSNMWFLFAILSAFFAALTSILAKIGIENVNSHLATAIRTVVVLIMAWGIVFITGSQNGISQVSTKSFVFLYYQGFLLVFLGFFTTMHFK